MRRPLAIRTVPNSCIDDVIVDTNRSRTSTSVRRNRASNFGFDLNAERLRIQDGLHDLFRVYRHRPDAGSLLPNLVLALSVAHVEVAFGVVLRLAVYQRAQ